MQRRPSSFGSISHLPGSAAKGPPARSAASAPASASMGEKNTAANCPRSPERDEAALGTCLAVPRAGLACQRAEELCRPAVNVVGEDAPAHPAHPPGGVLARGFHRRHYLAFHGVDVVGVDEPGLGELTGSAGQ